MFDVLNGFVFDVSRVVWTPHSIRWFARFTRNGSHNALLSHPSRQLAWSPQCYGAELDILAPPEHRESRNGRRPVPVHMWMSSTAEAPAPVRQLSATGGHRLLLVPGGSPRIHVLPPLLRSSRCQWVGGCQSLNGTSWYLLVPRDATVGHHGGVLALLS